MICRLCLNNLSVEMAVSIFNKTAKAIGVEIYKLITKYMQLELYSDDSVSTSICSNCCEQLYDFHKFCINIEQKQKTLQNQQPYEFLEIKSDYKKVNCDKDVETSAIKEELFEYEIDSICEDGHIADSHSREFKEDTLRQSEPINKKSKKTPNASNCKTKAKIKRKPKRAISDERKGNSSIDIEDVTTESFKLNCVLCQEHVSTIKDLINHFEMQHSKQDPFVKCCGKKFMQAQSIAKHLKGHHSPKKFCCTICNKILRSETNLAIHIKSKHNEDKKQSFKCHLCQKEFQSQKYCKNHILRHSYPAKNQINCEKCKRRFSSVIRLKRHCQIMHEAVYPYKCQACDENFVSKKDLEDHHTICKNRHVLKEDQKACKNEATELICKICCKMFANSNRLRKHVAFVHENLHPYVCEQCGRKFKFKPTFETHLLQHAGIVDPPAQCNICGKWLKHKNSLRLHLYAHDNAVNKCELCNHESPTRTALRHHVKKVHRLEREYQCKYCEKSFKDSKSQEEHIATHTGAQLYSCTYCSKETRSSSNMYAHIKRMHPEDWLKAKLARSHDPNAKTNLEVLTS